MLKYVQVRTCYGGESSNLETSTFPDVGQTFGYHTKYKNLIGERRDRWKILSRIEERILR